jgi:uncharacterized phage protein gp47/JayE
MATYGLLPSGFSIPGQSDILDDINSREQAAFGNQWDVSADSPEGQLNGVFAAKLSELWEVAQAVYQAGGPDGAVGAALDQILQLTGVTRLPATFSTGFEVLVGTNNTVVPAGTQFGVSGATGSVYSSNTTATIITLASWAATTAYAQGALVQHDTGKVYSCTTAGTSAGSGGPTGTSTTIVDGSCVWFYVAAGTAAVQVPITATALGPTGGVDNTITVINTPVGGLSAVNNPLGVTVGQNIETDAAARIRRNALLRNEGLASDDAIRATVLAVANVVQAVVLDNSTGVTDGNGTPPHAFQTVVEGGATQDIVNAIFKAKPAGIQAYGTTTGTATDSYGNTYTIGYTIPSTVPIYVSATLVRSAVSGAYAGDAAVQQAMVNYITSLPAGGTVVRTEFYAAILAVAGVLDVTALTLGTSASPVGTSNITNTIFQQPTGNTVNMVLS